MSSTSAPLWKRLAWPLTLILSGCIVNNIALEVLITDKVDWSDKGCGPLLTLLQYILVSVLTLPQMTLWTPHKKLNKKSSSTSGIADGNGAALQKKDDDDVHKGVAAKTTATAMTATTFLDYIPFVSCTVTLRPRLVPLGHYVRMAGLFAVMSLLNNLAFAFHISQPMHMVFRSANLIVTVAFGMLFFNKRYQIEALQTIGLLSAGAICNTIAEATIGDTAKKAAGGGGGCSGVGCGNTAPMDDTPSLLPPPPTAEDTERSAAYMFTFFIGVMILTSVLCLQSVLGEYQNWVRRTYTPLKTAGKGPTTTGTVSMDAESMFYMHAFSVPILAVMMLIKSPSSGSGAVSASGLLAPTLERLSKWSASPAAGAYLAAYAADESNGSAVVRGALGIVSSLLSLTGLSSLPIMWYFVFLNMITQYVCIKGVYALIGASDNLTVNVVLTVRKAVSVIVSVVAFGNTFTAWHWLGASLVFAGAYMYQLLPSGGMASAPATAASGSGKLKVDDGNNSGFAEKQENYNNTSNSGSNDDQETGHGNKISSTSISRLRGAGGNEGGVRR